MVFGATLQGLNNPQGTHLHMPIAPQHGPGLSAKNVAAFNERWCRHYAESVSKFLKAPLTDRCLHCVQTHGEFKSDKKGNVRLNERISAVLPDRVCLFPESTDWEEGRWEHDASGSVLHCPVEAPNILARMDCGAKTTQMTPKVTKPWKEVLRRVTLDADSRNFCLTS